MTDRERPIKALGEIALPVTDLDVMQRFYEDIVGLELLRRTDNAAFFKIADGYGVTLKSSLSSIGRPVQVTEG